MERHNIFAFHYDLFMLLSITGWLSYEQVIMKIGVFQVIMSLKKLLSPLVSTTEPMTVIKYGSAFIPLEKHKKKCSGFIYYFFIF